MINITPCLWFDNNAEEAVTFYTRLINGSSITLMEKHLWGEFEGRVRLAEFSLGGLPVRAFDAGPMFKFTPATSFFVEVESEEEVDRLWNALSDGAMVRMDLQKYDFSEKYGWLVDRHGLDWQIGLSNKTKISPALLFVGEQFGKAEEAMDLYTEIFPDSAVASKTLYPEGSGDAEGAVMYGTVSLAGLDLILMDAEGSHDYSFSEAFSLSVDCENQSEVDLYWDKLTAGGGKESSCGWLKDRFGVSWQVVPSVLEKLLGDPDQKKVSTRNGCTA